MTEKFYKLPQDIAARRDLKSSDKIVLMVICDAMRGTGESWPGVRTISKASGLSGDTIISAIKRLEKAGILSVHRQGNGKSTHYKTVQNFGTVVGDKKSENRSEFRNGGVQSFGTEPFRVSEPNKTDELNQTKRGASKSTPPKRDQAEAFEKFWKLYPKKVDRAGSQKAFLKINSDLELFSVMMTVLEQQKQSSQWAKDDGRYIPHPAKWLNQRRWEDLVEPSQADDDENFWESPEAIKAGKEFDMQNGYGDYAEVQAI